MGKVHGGAPPAIRAPQGRQEIERPTTQKAEEVQVQRPDPGASRLEQAADHSRATGQERVGQIGERAPAREASSSQLGLLAANRATESSISSMVLDGEFSAREEGQIRDALAGFPRDVADQVVARAHERAAWVRGEFDQLSEAGVLGKYGASTPENTERAMQNYVPLKAEALVDQHSSWINLKEDALGQQLAQYVKESPGNANRVAQEMLEITSDHLSDGNRAQVASEMTKAMSRDELQQLEHRTLTTLQDALAHHCMRSEQQSDGRFISLTLSHDSPSDAEAEQLDRVDYALDRVARPSGQQLRVIYKF